VSLYQTNVLSVDFMNTVVLLFL